MATSWLQHPLVLKGHLVELHPLEEDALDELFKVASDPEIWRLTSVDYSDPSLFYPAFKGALRERQLGHAYPFLVRLAGSGTIIGTTRLLDVNRSDKRVEIGVTFIARAFWGRSINQECKQMLLRHCFEHLGVNRVQFRAKADNARSRRALENIGATLEGILRQDKIEPHGNPRDTAIYSIVRDEWPSVRDMLASQLAVIAGAPSA